MGRTVANIVSRAFTDLPRVFVARWHDEDEGWRQMQVIAATEQEVRDTLAGLASAPVQVYRCAI